MSSESRNGDDRDPAALREHRALRRTEPMRFDDHPEWHRLSQAVRRQVEACVELDADNERLAELADQADALATALESLAHGKRVGLVEHGWTGAGPQMSYLPFSPIMGRLNPASYALEIHREGEQAVGTVTLGETAEGAVGLAHGGVLSGIWDEVLAAANAIHRTGGPTGRLTIHYRRPTPLYEKLRFEAWVDRIEERKVLVHGRCVIDGQDETLTEADGLFVRMREPGIDWNRRGRD